MNQLEQSTSINLSTISITSDDYQLAHSFDYTPVSVVTVSKIKLSGYLLPKTPNDSSNPSFSYNIRIVNKTNNKILGEKTFTNSVIEDIYIDLTLEADLIGSQSFEVHVKQNNQSGTMVKLLNGYMYYNVDISANTLSEI